MKIIHNEDLANCVICGRLLRSQEGIEVGYDSDYGYEYECRICHYK